MSFLSDQFVREIARQAAGSRRLDVSSALRSVARRPAMHFDIFLSQTIRDAEIVLGVYHILVRLGFSVFCDWVDDANVDRSLVTPANAAFIRSMMEASDTLLFLDTEHADQSLWMCWELGWFDGRKGLVGVLPVLEKENGFYRGREFLGLYPYVEMTPDGRLKVVRPVVAAPNGMLMLEAPNWRMFDSWRRDPRDLMRPRVFGFSGDPLK